MIHYTIADFFQVISFEWFDTEKLIKTSPYPYLPDIVKGDKTPCSHIGIC